MSTGIIDRDIEATQPITSIGQAAEVNRAIAEIQSALTIAQRCPRDEKRAIDRIATACQRPGLAEHAEYSYSKGGTEIVGASIDLLTVCANCWGNIQFGFRELSQRNGESTVEAFAWDLETNSKRTVVFVVPHVRHTKHSVTKLTDPRDIYEVVANNAQRRVRACLEAIIPPDVVEDAVKQTRATLQDSAPVTKDSLGKLAAAFLNEFGVTTEQIEARLQRRLETITPSQFASMRRIYKSLKDGMSNAASWFAAPEKTGEEPPAETLKDRMKKTAAAKKPEPEVTELPETLQPDPNEPPSEFEMYCGEILANVGSQLEIEPARAMLEKSAKTPADKAMLKRMVEQRAKEV